MFSNVGIGPVRQCHSDFVFCCSVILDFKYQYKQISMLRLCQNLADKPNKPFYHNDQHTYIGL